MTPPIHDREQAVQTVLTELTFSKQDGLSLPPTYEDQEVARRIGDAMRDGLISLNPFAATIERALSRTGIGPTKNGRVRTVIVPPAAQDALLNVAPHKNGLLFCSPAERMWTQPSHHRYWARLRLVANRPGLDFYELRHCAATMLLERGVTPWDVAVQLGHTDGGQLVMETYGHPSEAGSRARILAAWDAQTGPTPLEVSGARREQAG